MSDRKEHRPTAADQFVLSTLKPEHVRKALADMPDDVLEKFTDAIRGDSFPMIDWEFKKYLLAYYAQRGGDRQGQTTRS